MKQLRITLLTILASLSLNMLYAEEPKVTVTTRAEWLQLDYSVSRQALVDMTPEQKQLFWIDKINETLQFDWNPEERRHLNRVITWLKENPGAFENGKSEEELKYVEDFLMQWAKTAEQELGWSKKLIAALLTTGNSLKDKSGDIIFLKGQVSICGDHECGKPEE